MLGADTNIIVRFFVEDDAAQSERVRQFFAAAHGAGESILLSKIVLCEAMWTLTSVYGLPKAHVLKALAGLIENALFQIEDEDAVREAIFLAESGKGDFSDHLIGAANRLQGCRYTATFDRALRNSPAFQLL